MNHTYTVYTKRQNQGINKEQIDADNHLVSGGVLYLVKQTKGLVAAFAPGRWLEVYKDKPEK